MPAATRGFYHVGIYFKESPGLSRLTVAADAAVLTSPSTGSATSKANSTLPRPQMPRTPSGGLITRHA
jgi:hypothetical protein